MASGSKGRGNSWRHPEILDLLDVWGEEKIQEQLRATHRNIDSFEVIAEELQRRGHNRTAVECRRKTKNMRLDYRRVIMHNAKSGNNATTCPYFSQLHSILRGDATIRPKRAVSSLEITRTMASSGSSSSSGSYSNSSSWTTQEDDHGPLETVNSQDLYNDEDFSMDSSENNDSTLTDNEQAPTTVEQGASTSTTVADATQLECNVPQTDTGIPNTQATLSPATRLAIIRNRKTRRSANMIVERLIQHSSSESAKTREILKEDSVFFQDYLRKSLASEEEYKRDRKLMINCIAHQSSILERLVDKIPDANSIMRNHNIQTAEIAELHCAAQRLNVDMVDNDEIRSMNSSSATSSPERGVGIPLRPKRLVKRPLVFSP